ncbi:MAG: TonB-dependent receptor, partial [Bryobacteraceae bacterium]
LPITGGLFLEEDAAELLRSSAEFPITQDQRHTASARLRCEVGPRARASLGAWYGSGLPVEGAEIGVRRAPPSWSVDLSVAVDVRVREKRAVRVYADVMNVTDRFNVINLAGLFSGTALAAGRSVAVRGVVEF